ncbi:MAG: hypothetical protein AAF403_07775, partial [Pseudomonadota bacterium]
MKNTVKRDLYQAHLLDPDDLEKGLALANAYLDEHLANEACKLFELYIGSYPKEKRIQSGLKKAREMLEKQLLHIDEANRQATATNSQSDHHNHRSNNQSKSAQKKEKSTQIKKTPSKTSKKTVAKPTMNKKKTNKETPQKLLNASLENNHWHGKKLYIAFETINVDFFAHLGGLFHLIHLPKLLAPKKITCALPNQILTLLEPVFKKLDIELMTMEKINLLSAKKKPDEIFCNLSQIASQFDLLKLPIFPLYRFWKSNDHTQNSKQQTHLKIASD